MSSKPKRKMLRVARRFGRELPLTVRTTFLGAHALPPEYAARADDYIDEIMRASVAGAWLGKVSSMQSMRSARRSASRRQQTERVFQTAQRAGLPVKLHAEQLSDQGGAQLVARYGGLSADHLE